MTAVIEWTYDAQCAAESAGPLGPPRWQDDHLPGILFQTEKEYDFFAAIAGVRSRFAKANLIPPRGLPEHISIPASFYFRHGVDCGGWLHLSEIDRCIAHISDGTFHTGFELEIALDLMRRLVSKLTDPHVRLVFDIESP